LLDSLLQEKMGKFYDDPFKVNKNQDDSFCSERSEDIVFIEVKEIASSSSPTISSPPQCSVRTPCQPILLRARVHHYSSPFKTGDMSDKLVVAEDMDDNRVNFVQQRALLDGTHKIVTKDEVLSTLSDHVSKIRLEGPSFVSERARLSSLPLAGAFSTSSSVDLTPSQTDLVIERASLASSNCTNKLFFLPDLEPPDCCSPSSLPTVSSQVSLSPLPPYTIDREQLFPGAVFDSHCHLDFIYRRLRGVGHCSVQSLKDCLELDGEELGSSFGGCVANFCNPADWAQGRSGRLVSSVIKDSVKDRRVFMTIGCHPHYSDRMQGVRMDQLALLVSGRSKYLEAKVVAMGECGLDYSKKNTVDKVTQKQVFTEQLKIALEYNLPLVLHIRDAEADGYAVLKSAGVPPEWPIHRHCFTGDWVTASAWLDQYPGSMIGVTGLVTYQEAGRVREVVRNIPLDRLLLETDAPYFLPARTDKTRYPWNSSLPGHVLHVAAQVAAIKGVELRVVLEQNLRNVKEIYRVGSNCGGGKETKEKVEIIRAKLN